MSTSLTASPTSTASPSRSVARTPRAPARSVNSKSLVPVVTYKQDGPMTFYHNGHEPSYVPNSKGKPYSDYEGVVDDSWESDGEMVRQAYTLRENDDDWSQPHALVREVFDDAQRDRLVETVSGVAPDLTDEVWGRVIWYWKNIDAEVGQRIEDEGNKLRAEGAESRNVGVSPKN